MIDDIAMLEALERKVRWLSAWMIHHANHIRPNPDGLKVGGHQASSASLATIMTALYFAELRPQDRVAVKPHASPVFHAIQYLLGHQSREALERFRGLGGAQSYPSRTKDTDDVDFSTGSVGLGVAQTLFASLAQDYVRAHDWGGSDAGRMVALVGDAELDEGNVFEALLEGSKHGLRNTWWVVDYNRQSLDAVTKEGLLARFTSIFEAFGWDVVVLKYGTLQKRAFAEPGGEALRRWIDACPNQDYAALTFQGGAAWRKRLMDDLGDQGPVSVLIGRRSDEDLATLMGNLGGHDLPELLAAFEAARAHERPVCFFAYTIKGHGLPLAGHKDNHAGLMTPAQMDRLRASMRIRPGHEWDRFEGLDLPEAELGSFLERVPFAQEPDRRYRGATIPAPKSLALPYQETMSTQQAFGAILNEIAGSNLPVAERIVTTSPDVTVSTNLGPWVNRRGLFARQALADVFKAEKIPSTFKWDQGPHGQHIELGIAEMNLFILLAALGLSHSLFGERLLPIATVYDPFISRGLDALNYACYQDARFLLAATPSGVSLAPEGGAHQSIVTPLIGLSQDGLAAFEPAFADELGVIMAFALDYMQRSGDDVPDNVTWLRDKAGGALYLRLSTRQIEQPRRSMTTDLAQSIVDGAYWLREPGPNADLVIAYQGVIASEAISAAGMLGEDRRDIGLLAVTSADRLYAGWSAAQTARELGRPSATSHIERLLAGLPPHCALVTVIDGHPATLGWLGSVRGHRVRSLGVDTFGQSGTVPDLYRTHGIDRDAIVMAAAAIAPGRPVRHLRLAGG